MKPIQHTLILGLCLLFGSLQLNAQQEQNIFFLRDNFFSTHTNPAFAPKYVAMFNITPTFYYNLANTGFTFNDVMVEQPGTDSIVFSPTGLLNSLQDNNYLQQNIDIDFFSLALNISKVHVHIGARLRQSAYLNYPKSFFDLAWNGNSKFIGETVDIGPEFQVCSYTEFYLGGGYTFFDNRLSVGLRNKFLIGIGDVSTAANNATLYTDPEYYQMELATNYTVNGSLIGLPNLDFDTTQTSGSFSLDSLSTGDLFPSNYGTAFDFGASFDVTDKLNIAVSVLDVGAITWKSQVSNLSSNGKFKFDGVDINAISNQDSIEFGAIADTLAETFKFQRTSNSYTTWLPTKFYIGATYKPTEIIQLGGLFYTEYYKEKWFPALTVNAQLQLARILYFSLSYGIRNRRFDNFGTSLMFDLGGAQFFVASDNILPIFKPYDTRNVNLRFGFHVGIKKKKKKKKD